MCKRSPFTETVRWLSSYCALPLSVAAKVAPRGASAEASVAISAGIANEPAIPRRTVRRLHEVILDKRFASYEGFILHLSQLEKLQMSEWSGLRAHANRPPTYDAPSRAPRAHQSDYGQPTAELASSQGSCGA